MEEIRPKPEATKKGIYLRDATEEKQGFAIH